jgi:hypothetical protein
MVLVILAALFSSALAPMPSLAAPHPSIRAGFPRSAPTTLQPLEVSPTFADVPPEHWAFGYIEALYADGYVAGCSTDPRMYCPDAGMYRSEGAVFVERGLHGAEYSPPSGAAVPFSDVSAGAWYADWVVALWADGYTAGCGTDPLIFCPQWAHTRAEAAVFFERVLHGKEYVPPESASQVYEDVPVGTAAPWFSRWVYAAHSDGFLQPCEDLANQGDQYFRPAEGLTRAEAACMMAVANGLGPHENALFVALWGNDSNPGTSAAPYKTLAKASSVLGAGETLHIYAGVYHERLRITSSGTASARITIKPYQGAVSIDLQSAASPAIDLQGSHVTVQGLEVKGSSGVCVNLAGDYSVADHLTVHECSDHGIYVNSAAHVQVLNNTVYRTVLSNAGRNATSGWGSAIKVRLSEDILVQGNTVYNNYGEGMGLRGSFVTVRGNTVYDNFSVGIYSNSDHLLVEKNFVYCTPNSGFERNGAPMVGIGSAEELFSGWGSHATDLTIINNIVYACKYGFRYGGAETGVEGAGLRNTVIAHNTIADTTNSAISIAYESAQANVLIANNIVATGGSLTAVSNPVGITFTHNLWQASPPSYTWGEGDRIGSPGISPGYSPASFRPPNTSLAIGGAMPLQAVLDDFDGSARGSNPDMGAFQH